jgi:lipid-binding SYLF domain-containing protein
MSAHRIASITVHWLVLSVLLVASAFAVAASQDEERDKVRAQSAAVLAHLYSVRPEAKATIADAAGYATFRNLGIKLGVAGTAKGRGLAVANASGRETFMRFVEVQAGLGAGVKKYDLVFVFDSEQALAAFIDKGWQGSAQSTVALKSKSAGRSYEGAAAVAPGVWLYQVTQSGLAAEVSLKGSKYFRDKDLD